MNVVITGRHYAITAALEYIVRAFKRLGHNVVTTGFHGGLYMPWENGIIVKKEYNFQPDISLPDTTEIPIKFVEKQLGDFIPDLWLDVNAGQYLSGKPKKGVKATFWTDPHVLGRLYSNIKDEYNVIFNPQKNYLLHGVTQHVVPFGADLEWHRPVDGAEKILDVSLIGNVYKERVSLFRRLQEMGFKTHFGLGVGKGDAGLLYSQTKVGVNWSSRNDITARVFELMACGIVPVMNNVPGINEFVTPGEDAILFHDLTSAIDLINHCVKNYDRLKEIGEKARRRAVLDGFFWDDRVRQMLSIIFRS